ncbi:60S ribosomal protein L27 [Blastocystis sp. subtype 4]|uniref:60S ribosomal protein L27 n=1 Tax=Blastocystis sp. subtype 4 TaxID=944170 RepID=UPI000711C781|nr:60S ribosomal protein L27 [Blastocystis sp. subtype 4]KNB45941.1 60S ribosomal protein L27 [Blastocystis sp. subtype 4]|eukprot:XP_014529374.1 60S ribosomal protein L27 [Blastocystis sp. subtype 4]
MVSIFEIDSLHLDFDLVSPFYSLLDSARTERPEDTLVPVTDVLVRKHRCHPSGRGKAGGLLHARILFDKL